MDRNLEYREKVGTVEDMLATLRDADVICGGGELCEPQLFYENFHRVAPRLSDIELIKGKRGSGYVYPFMEMPELRGRLNMVCHLYDGALRKCHDMGIASHLPSNLHAVSGSGMWEEDAYLHAETVILEVNPNLPRFPGALEIPLEKVDLIVEADYPATIYDVRSVPTETDLKIGAYAADFVHDGDCIQLGLGGMPDAVGNSFFDKKDLGLHTELFTPVMGDLIEAGVITGARKNIDTGKHVGNFILGDEKLYKIMSTNPGTWFRQASYTNDPFVIASIDNMVSINTAMEIDLTGQICSETIGPKQYSGTDGAQHSRGGRGIIAMSATAKRGTISKIKPILTPGSVVTISRNLADIIITEFGVAYLRGRTVKERALQLIQIAHPDFRDELTFEAKKLGYI